MRILGCREEARTQGLCAEREEDHLQEVEIEVSSKLKTVKQNLNKTKNKLRRVLKT